VEQVSQLDWSEVEPAIFGTMFERGLDPSKRSQLGAHYTDRGGSPAGTRIKNCSRFKPSWADPVALGGGIAALAIGAALILVRRPHFAKPS
jgi:hypothetical protein